MVGDTLTEATSRHWLKDIGVLLGPTTLGGVEDRQNKLRFGVTSEYERYVKSRRGPRGGAISSCGGGIAGLVDVWPFGWASEGHGDRSGVFGYSFIRVTRRYGSSGSFD